MFEHFREILFHGRHPLLRHLGVHLETGRTRGTYICLSRVSVDFKTGRPGQHTSQVQIHVSDKSLLHVNSATALCVARKALAAAPIKH